MVHHHSTIALTWRFSPLGTPQDCYICSLHLLSSDAQFLNNVALRHFFNSINNSTLIGHDAQVSAWTRRFSRDSSSHVPRASMNSTTASYEVCIAYGQYTQELGSVHNVERINLPSLFSFRSLSATSLSCLSC